MCIVTHVAQIITLYKIIHCVALHTLSGITQKVSTVKFLHRKVSIFCVHSGKIYTGQKKFTQAPPVVPVTNMRYDGTSCTPGTPGTSGTSGTRSTCGTPNL